ncbi:MAG: molybdopterin molybdotransferase MoeA [Synoicihabitans sp.]
MCKGGHSLMLSTPLQATEIITQHLFRLPSEDCGIDFAHGRVLREPISADRPMPAYDRVTMDGYAVNCAAWQGEPPTSLNVAGFQGAGMMAQTLADDDSAIEIATGAVLPHGADAVVPYEETAKDGTRITLSAPTEISPGKSIHPRGSDFAAGTELVAAGTQLTGREIAVAATVGAARVRVASRPSVAIVTTGDELMDVSAPSITPYQIRRSNDYALRAALAQSHLINRIERFHLRDHREEIESSLRSILAEYDMVVLTGGVSKGKRDHVPEVLAELGAVERLRGIAQRPGKPLWFGTTPRQTPIFALPGNPVSTYVCLHRYVLPALRAMAGLPNSPTETVLLGEPFAFDRPLAFMLPVVLQSTPEGQQIAAPAPFNTSGDIGGLLGTDGFVELPADQSNFAKGTAVRLWRWT